MELVIGGITFVGLRMGVILTIDEHKCVSKWLLHIYHDDSRTWMALPHQLEAGVYMGIMSCLFGTAFS
jgi:hypothetical protein